MTQFGNVPTELATELRDRWQPTRNDATRTVSVPDVVRDGNGDPSTNRADGTGVLVLEDDEQVGGANWFATNDLVHVTHPEQTGIDIEDKGFQEKGVTEPVQIEVNCTDRTADDGTRLLARERLTGATADAYGGLLGEVIYILEVLRLGVNDWDVLRHTVDQLHKGNSNARAVVTVDAELIATNTVQP